MTYCWKHKNWTSKKTIENKQSNDALLKEIEFLKIKMENLISNQKTLNETLIKCCKNQTMIEVKVENYINDLLKNMQNGSNSELGKWINSIFVAKSELEQSLDEITASVETKIKQTLDRELIEITKNQVDQTAQHVMNTISNNIQKEYMERKNSTNNDGSGSDRSQGGLSREEVFKIVKNALIQYDADKTGMFDYALETAGEVSYPQDVLRHMSRKLPCTAFLEYQYGIHQTIQELLFSLGYSQGNVGHS